MRFCFPSAVLYKLRKEGMLGDMPFPRAAVRSGLKREGRLSQGSLPHINLISIMKNNSYSFMLACMVALLWREQRLFHKFGL